MEIIPYIVVALIAMKTPQLVKESRYLKIEYIHVFDSVTHVMDSTGTFDPLVRAHIVDSIHAITLIRLGYKRVPTDSDPHIGAFKRLFKRRPRDKL